MPFDGITIRALCSELEAELIDSRIDKIHQPEKDEIVIALRTRMGTFRLLLSANPRWARFYLSSHRKENPTNPPAFCMLLRKYLEGGKIRAVKQLDFERVVHIDIEAMDDFREWKMKRLVCEFTGRHSNIILINPENSTIVDALKRYGSDQSSYREVLPGKTYIDPPDQAKLNPLQASFEQLVEAMWHHHPSDKLAEAIFAVFSGISPFSARQLCLHADIKPELPVEQCGDFEFRLIYQQIRELLSGLERGTSEAFVAFAHQRAEEFAPYPLLDLPEPVTLLHFDSVNAACDTFYHNKLEYLKLESMKANLGRTLKGFADKAYKKQFLQAGDLTKAQESEKFKVWGEMITAYAHQLNKGDLEAVLDDFYSGEPLSIKLDPRYTPIQNAQKYFKTYNKSRSALRHLEVLMAQNQLEIDYLESVLLAIRQADNPGEIEEIVEELEAEGYLKPHSKRKKSKPARSEPRRFVSSDGLEILVGRNNRQNDLLSLKQATSTDLWLHTQGLAGTHVIVKLAKAMNQINRVPDTTLEEAASLAAHYSKAEQSSKVAVDYTFRAHVRKPAGAKPGMVIYDNYWTIMVNPNDERVQSLLSQQR